VTKACSSTTDTGRVYRRRYALGERFLLKVPEDKFKHVVFLVQDGEPRATGFLIGIVHREAHFPYVVTARHCIEETAGQPFDIRINVGDGYHDIPTQADDWFLHDTADVATTIWHGQPGHVYDMTVEGLYNFVSATYDRPARLPPGADYFVAGEVINGRIVPSPVVKVEVGHDVCFTGLLYHQPGEQKNLPIARFGNISRMPGEPIGIKRPGNLYDRIEAYLVECHSWGGNSGSPAYWCHPITTLLQMPDPRPGKQGETIFVPHAEQFMNLLGLMSGHLDILQEAETTGDIGGTVRTKLNSGIAVVTPAEKIRELLMSDGVVADRDQLLLAQRAKTTDLAPPGGGGDRA
jgi:hypothetical protein